MWCGSNECEIRWQTIGGSELSQVLWVISSSGVNVMHRMNQGYKAWALLESVIVRGLVINQKCLREGIIVPTVWYKADMGHEKCREKKE